MYEAFFADMAQRFALKEKYMHETTGTTGWAESTGAKMAAMAEQQCCDGNIASPGPEKKSASLIGRVTRRKREAMSDLRNHEQLVKTAADADELLCLLQANYSVTRILELVEALGI